MTVADIFADFSDDTPNSQGLILKRSHTAPPRLQEMDRDNAFEDDTTFEMRRSPSCTFVSKSNEHDWMACGESISASCSDLSDCISTAYSSGASYNSTPVTEPGEMAQVEPRAAGELFRFRADSLLEDVTRKN